jgi:C4-dicarboxylate transporter, DctQ subunit
MVPEKLELKHPGWRAFDATVYSFAVLACVALVLVFVSVIFDVTIRYTGMQSPSWPVPLSEYGIHISVMFGAPYVLQQRGHVIVDAFLRILPQSWQVRLLTLSKLLCLIGCIAFAVLAWRVTWISYLKGYEDVRAISVPEFILYGPMAISFTLMSIEFFHLLFVASPETLGSAADV